MFLIYLGVAGPGDCRVSACRRVGVSAAQSSRRRVARLSRRASRTAFNSFLIIIIAAHVCVCARSGACDATGTRIAHARGARCRRCRSRRRSQIVCAKLSKLAYSRSQTRREHALDGREEIETLRLQTETNLRTTAKKKYDYVQQFFCLRCHSLRLFSCCVGM